jgi:hypothetical protein
MLLCKNEEKKYNNQLNIDTKHELINENKYNEMCINSIKYQNNNQDTKYQDINQDIEYQNNNQDIKYDNNHNQQIRSLLSEEQQPIKLKRGRKKTKHLNNNDNIKKKGPGRPRKNPIREPQIKNGIVNEPLNKNNLLEASYDAPEKFKKILTYLKLHAVDKLYISFYSKFIYMWCEDNIQKNKIRVKIDCSKLNHYYIQNELNIGLSCEHLEKIMATIDKTYSNILFISNIEHSHNYLQIVLKDDMLNEEIFKVDLISDINTFLNINHIFDIENTYMISFQLPSKKFKKMISDMISFTDQVSIELDSISDPLIIQYQSSDNKIKHKTNMNSDKIKLICNLESDDTFHTSFKLDYVRGISCSVLSEYIYIYADENKPLLFINNIDNNCIEIRTLTSIIDKRKEIDFGL